MLKPAYKVRHGNIPDRIPISVDPYWNVLESVPYWEYYQNKGLEYKTQVPFIFYTHERTVK